VKSEAFSTSLRDATVERMNCALVRENTPRKDQSTPKYIIQKKGKEQEAYKHMRVPSVTSTL
jgi:hypothetical protein